MPSAVAAAASFATTIAGAVSSAWGLFSGSIFADIVYGVALSSAVSYASQALRDKPDRPSLKSSQRTQMVRESVEPRDIVYGKVRKSGVMVYAESRIEGIAGEQATVFHLVITLAGHPIESIDKIFFDDEEVQIDNNGNATGQYSGKVQINKHLGNQNSADSDLVSNIASWDSDHVGNNTPYLYVQMEYDQELFPGGIPNVSAVIKGKNDIYDPRTNTSGYTTNSALCLADYITDDWLGYGDKQSQIHEQTLIDNANVCDQSVNGQKRYTTNGVIKSSERHDNVFDTLTSSMVGSLNFSRGKWYVRAGAYNPPNPPVIDESNFIGETTLSTRPPKESIYNKVRGVFISPKNKWQTSDVEPIADQSAISNDGEVLTRDMEFHMTTSHEEARRNMRTILRQGRQMKTFEVTVDLIGLNFRAGEFVKLDHPRYGWDEKIFQIKNWNFSITETDATEGPTIAIEMTLKESGPSVYPTQTEPSLILYDPVLAYNDQNNASVTMGNVLDQTSGFTAEISVRPEKLDKDNQILFSKDDGNKGWGIKIGDPDGGFTFYHRGVGDGLTRSPSHVLTNYEWYSLAVSWDSTDDRIKLYRNGAVLTERDNVSGSLSSNSSDLVFGGPVGGNVGSYLHGSLEEARLWSDVRSETEIRNNLYENLSGNEQGLIGYWPMDNGSGTTVYDDTGNNNSGTINNAGWINKRIATRGSFDNPRDSKENTGYDELTKFASPSKGQMDNATELFDGKNPASGRRDLPKLPNSDTSLSIDGLHNIHWWNGSLYMVMGTSDSNNENERTARFDPETETWTDLTPRPSTNTDNGCSVLDYDNGKIYLATYSNGGPFFAYDIANDQWTTLSNQPSGNGTAFNMVYDDDRGEIHAYGGDDIHWKYDIASDSWDTSPPNPAPLSDSDGERIATRLDVFMWYHNDNIYTMGGLALNSNNNVLDTNRVGRYDKNTQTWSEMAAMPHSDNDPSTWGDVSSGDAHVNGIIVGDKITVVQSKEEEVMEYDISSDSFSQIGTLPVNDMIDGIPYFAQPRNGSNAGNFAYIYMAKNNGFFRYAKSDTKTIKEFERNATIIAESLGSSDSLTVTSDSGKVTNITSVDNTVSGINPIVEVNSTETWEGQDLVILTFN